MHPSYIILDVREVPVGVRSNEIPDSLCSDPLEILQHHVLKVQSYLQDVGHQPLLGSKNSSDILQFRLKRLLISLELAPGYLGLLEPTLVLIKLVSLGSTPCSDSVS